MPAVIEIEVKPVAEKTNLEAESGMTASLPERKAKHKENVVLVDLKLPELVLERCLTFLQQDVSVVLEPRGS